MSNLLELAYDSNAALVQCIGYGENQEVLNVQIAALGTVAEKLIEYCQTLELGEKAVLDYEKNDTGELELTNSVIFNEAK